jgi:hypothetical protein
MDARTSVLQPTIVKAEQKVANNTTHVAGQATADDSLVLHAAIGLAEQIQTASDEIERGRRLPPGMRRR